MTSRCRVHEQRRRDALSSQGLHVRRLHLGYSCSSPREVHLYGDGFHLAVPFSPLLCESLVFVHCTWCLRARPGHIVVGFLLLSRTLGFNSNESPLRVCYAVQSRQLELDQLMCMLRLKFRELLLCTQHGMALSLHHRLAPHS